MSDFEQAVRIIAYIVGVIALTTVIEISIRVYRSTDHDGDPE